MNVFNSDNTEGYTDVELEALNAEFEELAQDMEEGTEDWYELANEFSDEVGRR